MNAELKSYIERVARLEGERRILALDIKAVCDEAKGKGFSSKAIKKVVKIMNSVRSDLESEMEIVDLYLVQVGSDPLFGKVD